MKNHLRRPHFAPLLLLPVAALLFGITLLAGCSRKNSESPQSQPASQPASIVRSIRPPRTNLPPVQRLTGAEFYRDKYASAYDRFGRKNPRWDRQARLYLEACHDDLLGQTNANIAQLPALRRELDALECDDPLVNYLFLRQSLDPYRADNSTTNFWVEASLAFDNTGYPLYWQFYARARAAQAVAAARGKSRTNSEMLFSFRSPERSFPGLSECRENVGSNERNKFAAPVPGASDLAALRPSIIILYRSQRKTFLTAALRL